MLEVWSVQRKTQLFVQQDLADFESWVIEINWRITEQKVYIEIEALLLQTVALC